MSTNRSNLTPCRNQKSHLPLLGELIRDAHEKHPLIEGEDIIDFGLDPNYTYNDECRVRTICLVRIALTSDLYMSDNELEYIIEDEGWNPKGCAYMESFINETAPELLNYVYGEDSYEGGTRYLYLEQKNSRAMAQQSLKTWVWRWLNSLIDPRLL